MLKVVAILSGGLDSTTTLYRLIHQGHTVKAISFNYGQKHSKEIEMAKATCDKLGVEHTVVDITSLTSILSNSALTSAEAIPEGHYADETMKRTVVPNRNMIMASIAIGYAVNIGYEAIALGVHAGDHAIYPDCRPEFIHALEAISAIANYEPIGIYAPYIHTDKIGIVSDGLQLCVDFALTWTCYKGLDEPCGVCGSCVERKEAFVQNDAIDPLWKS